MLEMIGRIGDLVCSYRAGGLLEQSPVVEQVDTHPVPLSRYPGQAGHQRRDRGTAQIPGGVR
jgi:hypothetical protein